VKRIVQTQTILSLPYDPAISHQLYAFFSDEKRTTLHERRTDNEEGRIP